jgi:hypothetical protein
VKTLGTVLEGIGFSVFLTTVILAILMFPNYLPRHRAHAEEKAGGSTSIIAARDRGLVRLLVRTWKWGLYGGGLLMLVGAGLQAL